MGGTDAPFNFGRVLWGWWWLLNRDASRILPFAAIWVGATFVLRSMDYALGLTEGLGLLSTSLLVDPFCLGVLCLLALDDHHSGIGSAISEASHRYLALLGVYLLTMIGIGLGFLLLILPGLALAVFWAVALPVLIAEKRGPVDALRTSINYVRANFWSVLGLFAIYAFGTLVLLILVISLNLGGESSVPGLGLAVNALVSVVLSILGTYLNVAIYRELTVSLGVDLNTFD